MDKLTELRELAFRYAGVKVPDAAARAAFGRAAEEAAGFSASHSERYIGRAECAELFVPFPGADRAFALCVTLGDAPGRACEKLMLTDPAAAVLLDALASAMTETARRELIEKETEKLAVNGEYLSAPVLPGCAALPLSCAEKIAALCGAPKRIGIYATAAGALLPEKSEACVCAVTTEPQTDRPKCAGCPMRKNCAYAV